MTATHHVRAASTDDVDECARVLAAAFQADPGTMVWVPDDRERAAILPDFFRTVVAALIDDGHRRADELGLACYLETFSEPNVGYYEGRGYRTVGEFTIGDGVRGYGMLRPAS